MAKTMIAKVISELKPVSGLNIFPKTGHRDQKASNA